MAIIMTKHFILHRKCENHTHFLVSYLANLMESEKTANQTPKNHKQTNQPTNQPPWKQWQQQNTNQQNSLLILVAVFPVHPSISEQENSVPQSACIHIGDNIMLSYKKKSYKLYLTEFYYSQISLCWQKLKWLLQQLCEAAHFHYQLFYKAETIIPNGSNNTALRMYFGDLL